MGCEDGSCALYDLRSGCCVNTYAQESHDAAVSSVAFSQSGRLLFGASFDNKCFIFDTLRANCVSTLTAHDAAVSDVRVSPNGAHVATAGWDSRIQTYGL